MFVGGLTSSTTEQNLREYFNRFGSVKNVVIIYNTNKSSKGYGFVFFRESYMVKDAMDSGPHEVKQMYFFIMLEMLWYLNLMYCMCIISWYIMFVAHT